MAASITKTEETFGVIKKITWAWTAHTDGKVAVTTANAATSNAYNGEIVRLVTIPDSVSAPSDNYDVYVYDEDDADVLMAAGKDRDTANTEQVLAANLGVVANDKLTLYVEGAGSGGRVQFICISGDRMDYKIITAPTTDQVLLAEAKLHCRVDGAEEDSLISELISGAREYCEESPRRAFAVATFEAYLDRFPICNQIELPRPPLVSVTSVKYKDSAGVETTMTVNVDYLVDTDSTVAALSCPTA
jgi:hypothetical protein